MKKNKIMIVGPSQSGKTTIANLLNGIVEKKIKRTPSISYKKNTLELPGSYLESPWMRHHIIATQQDACCVVMICDPTYIKRIYPPGFSKSFRVPVYGIITKKDMISSDINAAYEELIAAGISKDDIYTIGENDFKSLEEIKNMLLEIQEKARKEDEIEF